ncbi:MAG: SagB/ThcOx family dehydrogenase [Deltaproteobacteria bacterium]|nr:SagB/ThcOx family dehydrogenase [Deltaproteobacteria bacterium]
MKNRETEAAWAYHDGTKHSYQSVRTNPHYLDWENQPIPFKIYSGLEPISLRQQLSSSGMAALTAIADITAPGDESVAPTSQTLAEILFLSAGVTRRRSYPGGEMLFRAAACTGALYHIDLYLACGDLEDLEAGVYHFSPHDFALRRLRQGDHRAVLARASGNEPSVATAPVILACASTYWRNAWKYQARAYRHCYWDSGTILANLLAAACARQLPAKVVIGFVDGAVSTLLGLDANREAPLSLVALGHTTAHAPAPLPTVEPLALETVTLSKSEIDYPAMRAMHEASSLENEEEVAAWRGEARQMDGRQKDEGEKEARLFSFQPLRDDEILQDKFEEVVIRRGSTRQFARESITFAQVSTMLDRATRGIPADFLTSGESLNDLYLIVHAVDDLPSGAYVLRRDERALELLKEGDFRREAGNLGLGQEIPADCSVNVYFLADLHRALERFGNRGYRAAQLEASIMGGKLYLAAYAQRLGASGLTFFDDDVTEFFSPHAAGKSVMFLLALGKSVKRKGLNVF